MILCSVPCAKTPGPIDSRSAQVYICDMNKTTKPKPSRVRVCPECGETLRTPKFAPNSRVCARCHLLELRKKDTAIQDADAQVALAALRLNRMEVGDGR